MRIHDGAWALYLPPNAYRGSLDHPRVDTMLK
jgi:hypothetical protein